MKKLLSILFFIFSVCSVFAQTNYYANDPEQIYSFDVKISVQQDGQIQVTENITLNVQHQNIKRGIYRDMPISRTEKVTPISLTMDGKTHPFFIENNGGSLRVNFGDDNYISKGKHTYSFTYSYMGAINFHKEYDELYWNVTGNAWSFPIDKAIAEVTFPPNTNIKRDGISSYTGKYGERGNNARLIGNLTFETTKPLSANEGFTIAIPFDKGAIEKPTFASYFKDGLPISLYITLITLVLFILYCIITWIKVGRDPFLTAVTQYEPPKGISPAFICFCKKGNGDKQLSCIILSLAMKKYIEIKEENGLFTLIRTKTETDALPLEERLMMEKFFEDKSTHILDGVLDESAGEKLHSVKFKIQHYFRQLIRNYRISNDGYKFFAFLFLCVLAFVPFIFDGSALYFPNIFIMIFLFPILCIIPKLIAFIIIGICIFITTRINFPLDTTLCQIGFFIGMGIIIIYGALIANLTEAGKELFAYLKGFEKYIKTAETNRFEASNPGDPERIFCDYLPFAYSIGLYNQWIKSFTGILSAAVVAEYIQRAGGEYAVARSGLRKNIHSSISAYEKTNYSSDISGGSHSSGSYGGGSSGGGHGGGGGGGR